MPVDPKDDPLAKMLLANQAIKEGWQTGPLGIPVNITAQDPTGMGDRSSTFGSTAYIPSKDPSSVPHESMHANLRTLEGPLGMLGEGLLSAGAEKTYGNLSQYLNPFERIAYGYQEGYTGQPDTGYQKAVATPHEETIMQKIMSILGGGADIAGRKLGEWQRPKPKGSK